MMFIQIILTHKLCLASLKWFRAPSVKISVYEVPSETG